MTRDGHALPFAATLAGVALYALMDALMKGSSLAIGTYSALLWRSVVAVLLPVDVPAAHGTAVASVLPAVVRAPMSRSIPPELPPPRA